ncbi:bifunctional phosphopantothenoylcysteine decarboxylase/phosphopantothenate--cysteine ligase CoaBC [Microvirga sp. W0021]|uniref:Coenzyme A biosynthesis bifunctional protein CoaBC n=1 Tax=Hohaiivirga grylli TaxID=3133970 RepID=A0ABV0BGM8_9HYPH
MSSDLHSLDGRKVLLIMGGGIAAYKSLDLIRRLKERGAFVRCLMTEGAQQFVTPLSAAALSGQPVHTDLFDRNTEAEIGHIQLAREPDIVIVAPATANLLARMAGGFASDLASAVLLATDKPVLLAPAMNPKMWENPATQRNLATLQRDGLHTVGPNNGLMAEAESGNGRMSEPLEIVDAVIGIVKTQGKTERPQLLIGRRIVVTSGPTHEPIDPVRYIANRSSGKQGHAIAKAAAAAGADVTLVTGPVNLPDPAGVTTIHVETADQMLAAVEAALPSDIGVFAAAVADWRTAKAGDQKLKKDGKAIPPLALVENPDILATISKSKAMRPQLVVGFAAETQNVIENAKAKLQRKGCDLIVANDVSLDNGIGVMGGDANRVHLISADGTVSWPTLSKDDVAERLVAHLAAILSTETQ